MSVNNKEEPTCSSSYQGKGLSARKHVLLGCTGSVAAVKVPLLVEQLLETKEIEVRIVATEHSLAFFELSALPQAVKVYCDRDEWSNWNKISDPILHIELRRWADLLVVAPIDANTLGKVASGICDNLLTCVMRAWDISRPLFFCPSMNTHMWEHPITHRQVSELTSWGYGEIPCVEKLLACGDKGFGAMAEVSTIVSQVKEALR